MGSHNGKQTLSGEDLKALSISSGLEENVIIEMFEDFLTKNPSGKMSPKAFRELMSQSLPKKDISKMEKHVFRIYDSDNDGFINFEEFLSVFHIMSDGTNEDVLRKVFRVFDVNGDRTISRQEMTRLVKDMYGLLKSETDGIASHDMFADDAFAEMDKDKDGEITEDEFVQACLEQKDFSKMLALKVIDILVEEN